jgi:hypothetical protein
MLLALRWPPLAQRDVALAVIGVYAAMELVVLVGARRPKYGRGVNAIHVLWPAQFAWGAWAAWSVTP